MSMEAQFYEARRRQNNIERRQSLRTQDEIDKQGEYQSLYIPVRIHRQDDKSGRCTCTPMRRIKIDSDDRSLYQRDRDIYPRPAPVKTTVRRRVRHPKLHKRFSSIEYLQQW